MNQRTRQMIVGLIVVFIFFPSAAFLNVYRTHIGDITFWVGKISFLLLTIYGCINVYESLKED